MGINIKKIAVLGGGTMGPGIAQMMAYIGRDVVIYDIAESQLEKSKATLRQGLKTFAESGKIKADEIDTIFNRVSYTTDFKTALEGTDMVFEAIIEDRKIKKSLYEEFDQIANEDVIFASNTSLMNIFEITPKRRLKTTLIAHWYAPASVVPLVEVVPSEETKEEITQAVVDLLEEAKKVVVRMNKFINGYIVNRIQACINQEIFYLLENGYCTPDDIDRAVKASFIPRAMVIGLVQKHDFAGVAMTRNTIVNKTYDAHPLTEVPHIMQKLIDNGDLGIQTGKGYYDYSDFDRTDVLAKRDKQLFEVFALEEKLMADPLGKVRDLSEFYKD